MNNNKLDWKGNDSTITGKELFSTITHSVGEIVEYIYVRFISSDANNQNSIKITDAELEDKLLHIHGHRKYGKCHEYLPEESITKLGIYYIKIVM